MRQQDPKQALSSSPLVSRLPAAIREEFVSKCRVRFYEPRERILTTGDLVSGPTWIEHGMVRAYLVDGDGVESPMAYGWPGDLLPPSIPEGSEWPCDIRTIAPTTLASIPRAALDELAKRSSGVGVALLDLLAAQMQRRQLWEAELRVVTLRHRLLKLLGRIADELGTQTSEGNLLDFPLTHGSLCFATWVSRDETGRAMRDLEEWGYFETRPRHRILVTDRDKLRHYRKRSEEEQ